MHSDYSRPRLQQITIYFLFDLSIYLSIYLDIRLLTEQSKRTYAFGRLDAHALEQLRVHERQLDALSQVANLVIQPADRRVGDVARVLVQHVVHHGVNLNENIYLVT
jgi:hypothetical protein